jgi:hypothetical protein
MWVYDNGYYGHKYSPFQTTSTNDMAKYSFDFNGHLSIEIDKPKKEPHQEIVLFDPENLVLEN